VRDYATETVRDAFNNGDDGQAAARGVHDPLRGDESHRQASEEAQDGAAEPGSNTPPSDKGTGDSSATDAGR
jgi:hypothetical protein